MELGTTFYIDIIVSDPTTGSAADADAAPVVDIFEDANDTPILSLTSVKRTALDGNYRCQIVATTGNGFEIGKSYAAIASATLGGVSGKMVAANFIMEDSIWNTLLDGTYTAKQYLRIIGSREVGKSTIINNGDGTATVIYRDLEDTIDRITGAMTGSERRTITLNT
jgi:hypothetical protein